MISGSLKTIMGDARRDRARGALSKSPLGVAGLIPRPVLDSPLMKKGGYEVFEGFPEQGTFDRMRAEALKLFTKAYASDVKGSAARGFVTRGQLRATGVGVQRAFYHRRTTLRFIREVSGLPMVPTGARGGYLYYVRPGDHVALHRDGEGCELVMLTCLSDTPDRRGDGGMLCLYPKRIFERAEDIQATPDEGAVKLRLLPGQTIVLLGGFVAHALLPVSEGQRRIVSSLCYRLVTSRHISTKQSENSVALPGAIVERAGTGGDMETAQQSARKTIGASLRGDAKTNRREL